MKGESCGLYAGEAHLLNLQQSAPQIQCKFLHALLTDMQIHEVKTQTHCCLFPWYPGRQRFRYVLRFVTIAKKVCDNVAGVSYVTFSADGTPMEYEEPTDASVIAIAEESVVETVEIPIPE